MDVENYNGARKATAHLLRMGRRRVAAITGPQNNIASADRREGYLATFRERGLSVDIVPNRRRGFHRGQWLSCDAAVAALPP